MSEKKEIFADSIGQINFAGNMDRFDFITLQPTDYGRAPTPQSNMRIIMPSQVFLSAFNSMQQLFDKLLDAAVLRKNEKPEILQLPQLLEINEILPLGAAIW
ncbi:MAG: hypothetical protein PHT71_01310 [Victivallaceae bacterium]|nr:hypothetical protein [Victivallaceae bacterium]